MTVDHLRHSLLLACCLLGWGRTALAGQPITVGADGALGGCDFTSVQAALDAADMRGGEQTVWVTRNARVGVYDAAWEDLHLVIDLAAGQSITVSGGYDTCTDLTPEGRGVLSGLGGVPAPVLLIRGAGEVSLTGLEIVEGDTNADKTGGGIDFLGSGSLSLQDVALNDNHGTEGGAIRFESADDVAELDLVGSVSIARNFAGHGGGLLLSAPDIDAPAFVTMGDDVALTHNEVAAPSGMGGGVRAEGYVDFSVTGERFEVAENRAGLGGGFSFGSAVVAVIRATPAAAAPATFHHNRAQHGGAISFFAATSQRAAELKMYSLDPSRPLSFAENEASTIGGALQVTNLGVNPIYACLQDVHIVNNRGAASVINAAGIGVSLRFNDCAPPAGTEITCTPDQLCSVIEQNSTMMPESVAPTGSIIHIEQGAVLRARHLRLRGNVGTAVVTTGGGTNSHIEIRDSLITANSGHYSVFGLRAPTDAIVPNRVIASTFADNELLPGAVNFLVQPATDLVIEESLIASSAYVVGYQPITIRLPQLRRVVAGSTEFLPPGADVVLGTPRFEADSTYTLADGSIGLDMLPPRGDVDLYGNPRDVDRSDVRGPGVRDVGAVETSAGLLTDGFE